MSSPLHSAAAGGDIPALLALLNDGADIESAEDVRARPACSAAVPVQPAWLPPQLTPTAAQGRTPLLEAAHHGQEQAVRLLLERGANPEAANQARVQRWPLARSSPRSHLRQGGKSALQYAAQYGHAEVARLLLESGANTETRNLYGWTAAHAAAYYGKPEAMKVLLEFGAQVEAVNDHGCTVLASAAKYGNLEVARLLLEQGADRAPRNADGESALDLARECGCDELVRLLS